MCAIFGIVGKSDPHLLKKISTVQLFRGPDSQQIYLNKEKSFCFGNNRLAVIDKKGGVQPMYSEDKSILVIFNGAIYNFNEISVEQAQSLRSDQASICSDRSIESKYDSQSFMKGSTKTKDINQIKIRDFDQEKEKEKTRDKLMEKKGLEKMKVRYFD